MNLKASHAEAPHAPVVTVIDEPSKTAPTERYVEQGIRVYSVSDYEWYAATDFQSAWVKALSDWGFTDPEEIAEHRECASEGACNLDALKFTDTDTDETMSFREQLRRLIANGQTFPVEFAAIDY